MGGADQLGDLSVHQPLDEPLQRLMQEVGVLIRHQIADDLLGRHPLPLGHRGALLSIVVLRKTDDLERRGGRNYLVLSAAVLHHATGRDPVATPQR
jgi:hypothetical protein